MRPADLSIVVPAYNAEATLESTLASALQADGLLEILVVDDGSTDGTLVRANELAAAWGEAGHPPLRVMTQSQAGPSAARNLGAARAQGQLLAFLDADDAWLAGVPDRRRALLAAGPTVALGLIQCYSGEQGEIFGDPFEGFQVGAALIPRRVFESVGPFEPGMDLGEDVDWFLRARDAGVAVVFGSDVVLAYRSQSGSLSARRSDRSHGLLDALHRSVDRRRSGEGREP